MTEDADLGIRLARLGYDVSLINSETLEDAPVTWRIWRGQRARWMKGWMQTYMVHMRRPFRLWRDLGAWRFCGFQVTITATLISMLVHPWFYILAASSWLRSGWIFPESEALLWLFGINLFAGYTSAALLVLVTSARSRLTGRFLSVLGLPIYWLAVSFAAYCAAFDLIRRPHFWEKTAHGEGRELWLRAR